MSAEFWILVIFAFLCGVLIGWILRYRTGARAQRVDASVAPTAKLGILEAELKKIRMLLDAKDVDATLAAEPIAGLDEAIQRANERIKLIAKAVKSTKFSD